MIFLGEGFNVNIPWNRDKLGNSDYKLAFDKIVCPIIEQFSPDLMLVASGFDAAAADIIGDYILSPDMFAYMTKRLKTLSKNGKILLSLEGGYSAKAVGESLCECLNVLLNDDVDPQVNFLDHLCKRTEKTVEAVIKEQSKYWKLS